MYVCKEITLWVKNSNFKIHPEGGDVNNVLEWIRTVGKKLPADLGGVTGDFSSSQDTSRGTLKYDLTVILHRPLVSQLTSTYEKL